MHERTAIERVSRQGEKSIVNELNILQRLRRFLNVTITVSYRLATNLNDAGRILYAPHHTTSLGFL
jgi:hypothetical protein